MSKTILNEFILRGRTSLRVNLSHINEFRIFYDFHSITFSLQSPSCIYPNIYIFIAIALDESIFLDVLHFPMKNIKSRDVESTDVKTHPVTLFVYSC